MQSDELNPTVDETELANRRRGGWPARTYEPGERVPLSWRVPPEFKAKLDASARRNGRSLAHEAERLIELGMIFETMVALGQLKLWGDAHD